MSLQAFHCSRALLTYKNVGRTGEIMRTWIKEWHNTWRSLVTCFWSAGVELSWHNM